jgi:membrane associated rhomboid family serine protease
MRQAAVGFQCPDCVAEGRRSTRSGRTTYGGRRTDNPALTSQVLIGINAVVWLLITLTGGAASPWVDRLALLPDGALFRMPDGAVVAVSGVADGAWWQLLTSMFTHVDLLHIGFNMLALWFLGPQLEAAIGRTRFLLLYLLSGLTGSLFVYWLSPTHTATVGASGAIFGLMGGLLILAIRRKADYSQILMWLGLNVVLTFVGRGFISWQGHLGGLVGGALIAAILAYAPRRQRTRWQAVGLGALGVLLVVGYAARTLALV